jgi:hypothetical protein
MTPSLEIPLASSMTSPAVIVKLLRRRPPEDSFGNRPLAERFTVIFQDFEFWIIVENVYVWAIPGYLIMIIGAVVYWGLESVFRSCPYEFFYP